MDGIMGNSKTELVVIQDNPNAQRYVTDVLTPQAIPFIRHNGTGVIRQCSHSQNHNSIPGSNNVAVLPWSDFP